MVSNDIARSYSALWRWLVDRHDSDIPYNELHGRHANSQVGAVYYLDLPLIWHIRWRIHVVLCNETAAQATD